jgi:hypothetical protein
MVLILMNKYISKIKKNFKDISISKTYSGEGIIIIMIKQKVLFLKGNNKEKKKKNF